MFFDSLVCVHSTLQLFGRSCRIFFCLLFTSFTHCLSSSAFVLCFYNIHPLVSLVLCFYLYVIFFPSLSAVFWKEIYFLSFSVLYFVYLFLDVFSNFFWFLFLECRWSPGRTASVDRSIFLRQSHLWGITLLSRSSCFCPHHPSLFTSSTTSALTSLSAFTSPSSPFRRQSFFDRLRTQERRFWLGCRLLLLLLLQLFRRRIGWKQLWKPKERPRKPFVSRSCPAVRSSFWNF